MTAAAAPPAAGGRAPRGKLEPGGKVGPGGELTACGRFPTGCRMDQLTSLRFVAAFGVMLSHLDYLADSEVGVAASAHTLLFRQGYCGVSFFYILSGFVIAGAYRDRLLAGAIPLWKFYYRRLCRILPLHWLVTAVFAVWLLVGGEPASPSTLALNLSLLHAWVPDKSVFYSLNGPSWSLSNELFFYAMFPLLIAVPTRALAWFVGAGIAVVAALALAADLAIRGYHPEVEWLFYVAPPVRLIEFAVGILLHAGYRRGWGGGVAGTRAEVAVLIAIMVGMIGFAGAGVPPNLQYQLAYLPIMTAAVIVFAHGRGEISRGLRSPLLVLLGEASFALYLTHRPTLTLGEQFGGDRGMGDIMLAAGSVLVCLVGSVIVYTRFERPLLRRLRRLEDGGPRRAMAGIEASPPSTAG